MLSLKILIVFSSLLAAEPAVQDPSAYMKQIWSPYCKGVSLMECPSSQAEKLRNEIYDRMQKGETFESVFANLSERYGDSLRMSPNFTGREAAAFWIPWAVAIAAAIFVLTFWMTRRRRKLAPVVKSYKPSKAFESRVQEELDDLRS